MLGPDAFDEDEEQLSREMDEWLPKRGDKLIQESPSALLLDPLGCSNPDIGKTRSLRGRRDLYSGGFLEAGDRLVEGLMKISADPALIYPIFYLYRHHVELELKGTIRMCLHHLPGTDPKEVVNKEVDKTHNLARLWRFLKKLYPNYNEQMPEASQSFESLLLEFHEHDPDSQAARYPVDSKGNQTFSRQRSIDMSALRSGVHKMSHYLDCIYEAIAQEVDWRFELASWGD